MLFRGGWLLESERERDGLKGQGVKWVCDYNGVQADINFAHTHVLIIGFCFFALHV